VYFAYFIETSILVPFIIIKIKRLKMETLTKKQMSAVRGGSLWYCQYYTGNGFSKPFLIEADTIEEAADLLHQQTGATQVNCTAY
jgi:hypothetical protein